MGVSDNNPDPLLQLTTDTWADHSATNETTNPSLSHETRRPSYPDSSARDNLEIKSDRFRSHDLTPLLFGNGAVTIHSIYIAGGQAVRPDSTRQHLRVISNTCTLRVSVETRVPRSSFVGVMHSNTSKASSSTSVGVHLGNPSGIPAALPTDDGIGNTEASYLNQPKTELVRSLWPLEMSTTTTIYAYALLLLRSGVTLARISSGGILYPQESESRDVRTLDGVWNFRLSPESDPLVGFREHWYNKELRQTGETIPMPVPASYNDITQDKAIRDHVGLVWYDRSFFVPDTWRQQGLRVWMRFGSVSYAAQVWVNGQLVMSHEIGHLPFQRDIASVLKYGSKNLVTVAVDNTLLETSIPQGQLSETYTDNGTQITQSYTFDFFNYAGISPSRTPVHHASSVIEYNVSYNGYDQSYSSPLCFVDLLDKEGKFVARDITTLSGRIEINSPRLWWPYLMDSEPGYLYTLQVRLASPQLGTKDVYRLPVGIRTVKWNNTSLLINGRPLYLRGFGKHEDSDIRGKGLDYSLVVKDYNLIKWIGANSFRTSHYPYAEEIMDFADRQGIVVINECPSVDTV
uniref:Beta-glucuronidase n=1 Tax=Timema californicum TaxID=61474 RepID=A0A7R9J826_TIMCA|nr:unnamed protein product [Timema californicum]